MNSIPEHEDRVLEEIASDGTSAGLEAEVTDLGWEIKAPFNPAQIDVITQVRTVDLLLTRLREGEMDLSPEFQRRANLWTDKTKSGLIESLLLRIPIPSLYVSEDAEGNYSVVDGLQRMCAIAHFVDVDALNKEVGTRLEALKLSGLQSLPPDEYNGKTFVALPRSLQRRIKETELTLHVIRASTPQDVKFNIFSRINRGGLPLTAQEIRNAIYPGHWRSVVRHLVSSASFLKATEGKIRGERMEDFELVLRFLAHYCLGDEERASDENLDPFLNNFVKQSQTFALDAWDAYKAAFEKSMYYAPKVFGRYAFRKYYAEGENRRPINRGLFESQAVSLAWLSEQELDRLALNSPLVLRKLGNLFLLDSDFPASLLYATGRGSSSNIRLRKLTKLYREVLDD